MAPLWSESVWAPDRDTPAQAFGRGYCREIQSPTAHPRVEARGGSAREANVSSHEMAPRPTKILGGKHNETLPGGRHLGDLLTCDAVAAQGVIERYLAGRVSEAEVEAFEAHYLTCSRCQRELRMAFAIRNGLPEAGSGPGEKV